MYDLKKAFYYLLLTLINSSLLSIVVVFILYFSIDLERIYLAFFILLFIFFLQFKEAALKTALKKENYIEEKEYIELSDEEKFEKFYQQISKILFPNIKPFININKLKYFSSFVLILISLIFAFFSFKVGFYSIIEYSFMNIATSLFYSLLVFIFLNILLGFFILKPLNLLFLLFIEPFCYLIKKNVDNHTTVYLKGDCNLYFYKGKKLHCDIYPAYMNFPSSTINIDLKSLNEKNIKEFIDDKYMNCKEEEWYLNGEKVEIDTSLPLENKQSIIKLMKISKDF